LLTGARSSIVTGGRAAETNKLFVGSGSGGKVYIYDGATYDPIATVDFEGGADNLRYDAANKRVYVACGDDAKTGAIGAIDAVTNRRLDETYRLGGEPESFQLEKSGPNMYVNVPDSKVPTALGAATAGYWGKLGKGFDRFFLAVPARGNDPAEIRIYVVQD
jgi:DNA-binding beta-propeller fold protein YncE